MIDLAQCTAWLGQPNVQAFLHVIRAGESDQTGAAYRIINGGTHFDAPPWRHPWHGIPTTQGAKACGAYQFLGTTWARTAEALGFGEDFSPVNQDLGASYLIAGRHAIDDVLAGNLVAACSKLRDEWISLPGLGLNRVQRVFAEYGGTFGPQPAPNAPLGDSAPPAAPAPPTQPTEAPMGALTLLQMFAPILTGILPQIAPLLGGAKAQGYAGIAQTVLDTITRTAAAPNLQAAVEKMQTDPAIKAAVQEAVVTHADVIGLMQIGGGIPAARQFSIDAARESWWRPLASGAMLMCVALLPLVYYTVYMVYTSTGDLAFTPEIRASVVSAIISGVLFGIVGYWLGTSYGSQRKDELKATAEAK